MGFRRSPDRITANRDWRRFVEQNAPVIAAAKLPLGVTDSIAAWDDFLMHGYRADDSMRFDVDQLDADQYAALVQLAASYFHAGYEFYNLSRFGPSTKPRFALASAARENRRAPPLCSGE